MLHSAITLDAGMKWGDALSALSNYPDDTFVVIRRRKKGNVYWYIKRVSDFRYRMYAVPPDTETLETQFDLHEPMGDPTYQARSLSRNQMNKISGVLLDGERPVGVLVEQPQTASRSSFDLETVEVFSTPAAEPTSTSIPVLSRDEAPVQISPYPRLEAPDNVEPGQEFVLVIGLSRVRVPGVAGAAINLSITGEEFDMTVQVFTDDFICPEKEGFRRQLQVKRSKFEEASTAVKLVAPQTDELLVTMLEVQYSYKGNVVGRAWRQIQVVPRGEPVPEGELKAGSRPLSALEPGITPDLTVTISKRERGQVLLWAFDTDLVAVPSYPEPPRTEFERDSAQTFANSNVKSIAEAEGKFIDEKIKGVGRIIAREMPLEFWDILGKVWTQAKNSTPERVPSILFISEDPYIPWELAITEKPFVKTSLIDSSRPPFLGAQLKVGRWLPAGKEMPEGYLFPKVPPETAVNISRLALVIGDYKGPQALPEAIEEGKDIKQICPAVWLDATVDHVNNLMSDSLKVEGEAVGVQAVHFACHGAVFPADARYTGIVLSDTGLRLGEDMIMGTDLPQKREPFVFMNACEVGLASETLGAYGGLAAAFVSYGARGFVAPLWKVNDKIAREIAVNFYKRTLNDGADVSEVMREVRSGFDITQEIPVSTYLAYVYYGHPNLVLRKVP